jgi:hypothetical protein
MRNEIQKIKSVFLVLILVITQACLPSGDNSKTELSQKNNSEIVDEINDENNAPLIVNPQPNGLSKCLIHQYVEQCDYRFMEKVVFNFDTLQYDKQGRVFKCRQSPVEFLNNFFFVEYDETINSQNDGLALGLNSFVPTQTEIRVSHDSYACLINGNGPYNCADPSSENFTIVAANEEIESYLDLIFQTCD